MKILLTGGTGYIGSHTAVALDQAGYEFVLLDNFSNSNKSVGLRLQTILNHPISLIEGDVRDQEFLIKILNRYEIDSVIHFAGLKAVGESATIPIEYYQNNVQGTISLLGAMKKNDIKKIIFSSSATVYGDPKYLPIDEKHPTTATNPYGRTKLHIEEMLSDLAKSDPEWQIICLRYFNPVGAHQSGLIGEDPSGIPNNLMPYIGQVASGNLQQLNIYGNNYPTPDGTGVRDYIHVMDLAEGHVAALRYLLRMKGWDAFNLGTGCGHSVMEMIAAFEKVSRIKIPYEIVSRRVGDVATCFSSVDKAKALLGWQTKRTIEEMCSSGWLWQRNRKIMT